LATISRLLNGEPRGGGRIVANRGPYSETEAERKTESPTNGFVARSWPKVEIGPWPGMKLVSSPIGHSLSVMEAIRSR